MWLIIFELTILTYFPLNPPWNYFWHFLFGWFISVTISQVLQTIYRKPCHWKSTFQCFQPASFVKFKHYLKSPSSPFSTYSSLNILLTYSLWMIVSSKHFLRVYDKFTATYVIWSWHYWKFSNLLLSLFFHSMLLKILPDNSYLADCC